MKYLTSEQVQKSNRVSVSSISSCNSIRSSNSSGGTVGRTESPQMGIPSARSWTTIVPLMADTNVVHSRAAHCGHERGPYSCQPWSARLRITFVPTMHVRHDYGPHSWWWWCWWGGGVCAFTVTLDKLKRDYRHAQRRCREAAECVHSTPH